MNREQEEDVLRITAHYVDEVRAGHQPNVSYYLAHHAQFAAEIADFVAYFHAFEADLPIEPKRVPELPEIFRIAIDSAYANATSKMTTLLLTAGKRRLTVTQLADKLGLSSDIVRKLEQRKITASSIPGELYERLAEVLHQSLDAIRAYFEPAGQPSHLQQVAESSALYQIN